MTAQALPTRTVPAARRGRRIGLLPKPLRKTVLVLHVAASVSWLGLTLGLLTLGTTALVSSDPQLVRSAYLAMNVFGQVLLAPVSLTALTTGLILALGTPWGLIRHRWVLTKLVLTVIPVVLTFLSLRPGLAEVAALATSAPDAVLVTEGLGEAGINMVVAPSVATTMYLTSTILSVVKPWGRTRWGRRAAGRA